MSLWDRVRANWGTLNEEQREEIREKAKVELAEQLAQKQINSSNNSKVQTRQVLRYRARVVAMRIVNQLAGGEPRRLRRKMALKRAAREWRASKLDTKVAA